MDTLRVLVVDDETGMRLAVARVLGSFTVRLGDEADTAVTFDVQTAESGEQALELMAAGVPDILLLDVKMPGISGLDVLREMNERGIQTLTVMITAYATLETAIDATKRGAHDFLPKPFTPDELRVAIRRVVKHLAGAAPGEAPGRGEAAGPLPVHLRARPRAEGAAGGHRGLSCRSSRTDRPGNDPAMQAQVVERASSEPGGMRRLIAELLDLTRIESGQKRRELADVDVREVAQAALDTVAPAASAARHHHHARRAAGRARWSPTGASSRSCSTTW